MVAHATMGKRYVATCFFLGRNLLDQVNLRIGFPSIEAQETVEETWSTLHKGETNWKQASLRENYNVSR